jgi:hypothetical protein
VAVDKQLRELLTTRQARAPVTAQFPSDGVRPNRAVRNICAHRDDRPPAATNIPTGYLRFSRIAEIARRRNARVILFFQPRHQKFLAEGGAYLGAPEKLTSFLCSQGIAFFDLTESYSDPDLYWATDHRHYLPHVGLSLLVDILRASNIPVDVR